MHIPSTVRDSLLARLDQLAPSREVAQVAAVIGREFSFSLLYQVAELRENDLHQALDSLEEAELLFRRGDGALATYRFKHALLLEATYSTLLHSRRIHLHRRIAEALETADGESTPAPPSVVAHHWTEAGEASRAIPAWRDAGQRSLSQSATEEAAAALRRGLELVPAAAQSEQAEFELELQTLNGWALIATEGYSAPQTQEAFNRALELCRASEDKSQLFAILHGCWANALLAARIDEAFALARELLEVAEGQHHSSHLVVANRVFGTTSFWRGDFQPAREHLDHALSQYNELEHTQIGVISMFDTRIIGLDFLSLTLLPLGQVQAARQNRQLAHAEARESRQHVTLAIILQHTCLFHLLAREPASVGTNARELVTLANDQNFPFWVAHGEFFLAWSEAVAHPSTASVNTLEAALSAVKATGSALFVPYYTALVSEQRLRVSPDQGQISTLQTCIAQLDETGERWCESELYRYLGEQELHAKLPQCIDSLERSLAIATSAGAHTLALRSSISLARACAHFEKAGEGKQLLVKSLSKLDGADITDVSDAQALLATPPFA
ncbi:MAG: hypothetical protein K0U93_08835 [Gammaproteobacteria bacterium]|nr:hypothetical protein [Gammaproteobacteria bacterium]